MYCKARDRPVLREANAKPWRVYKYVHDQCSRMKYLKQKGRELARDKEETGNARRSRAQRVTPPTF